VSAVPDSWADGEELDASPALSRLVLGRTLHRLREEAGISRETACQAIRASESKISRLELGRTGFKLRDVADLCTLYGVTDHLQRATLLGMAQLGNRPEWWHPYRDVIPAWFEPYLGLERAASVIRGYEVQLVPGLLQTQGYARAVIGSGHRGSPPAEIERRVELRMRRQQILHRPRAPRLWALIDEAALRRPVGGRVTMSAQIRQLLAACDMPNLTVQVLTFRGSGHVAEGPFTLLRLPGHELRDVIYLEHLAAAVYLDRLDDVSYYVHMMDLLAVEAESADATKDILNKILAEV
jgi:transcriptional regulator with XRE-family HTH domain